jgi:hypothetical protein
MSCVAAATAILDRAWGKRGQAVESHVSIFKRLTETEQGKLLAGLESLAAEGALG